MIGSDARPSRRRRRHRTGASWRARDQGFTLVEILIAIVLVGVISAVVVIGVGNLTDKGSSAACTASADAARTGAITHYATNLAYPTTFTQMTTANPPTLTLGNNIAINTAPIGLNLPGTVATGQGWTLTMTPGTATIAPTFTCATNATTPATITTPTTTSATTAPSTSSGTAACPGTYTGWVAEYYPNMTLSGAPALCRNDPSINFNWAAGSPAPSIPANNFSARWTLTTNFTAGAHTFTVGSDDGHRLYIDGTLVLDTWRDQAYATRATTQTLTSGPHTLTIEYYERGGQARATINWT
jgi:prepilin-type N-terminal cleavage/methylation domain-containing protein